MTTLCLEDLSERDFATLSRLPHRNLGPLERLITGSATSSMASTLLTERMQPPTAVIADSELPPARAW